VRNIFRRSSGYNPRALGKRRGGIITILDPLSVREKLIYGGGLLFILITITTVIVRANISDVGSIMSFPATQCSANSGWQNPELAQSQPDVAFDGSRDQITEKNAAKLTDTDGVLTCIGYKDTNDVRTATALNISLSVAEVAEIADEPSAPTEPQATEQNTVPASEEPVVEETASAPEVVFSETSFEPLKVDGRVNPTLPNVFGSEETDVENPVFKVEISGDQGDTWSTLHLITKNELSTASPHVSILIPDGIAESLSQFAFRLELVDGAENYTALVDSMAIVYEIGLDKEIKVNALDGTGKIIEDEIPLLAADEEVVFEISAKDPNDGVVQGIVSNVSSTIKSGKNAPGASAKSVIIDSEGEVVVADDTEAEWKDVDISNTDKWDVPIKMPRSANPGVYTLKMEVTTEDGAQQRITQNFLWGVLALNTDKTIYSPNESGRIMMTVLNELGATVCKADLVLTISGPGGASTLSTSDSSIIRNDSCEQYGTQITPDFEASYQFTGAGEYSLDLTATTSNGQYQIIDKVFVENTPLFDVTRSGPTRIYPVVDYPITLDVVASQDFSGTIVEEVPASFKISTAEFGQVYDRVSSAGDVKTLTWDVSLKAGQKITLGYRFDAPDISPEFYLLGPLTMNDGNGVLWQETRSWQIAGDALDIIRVTTYELEAATFTGATYNLTLNNDLASNYYTVISGPSSATSSRGVDQDQARVTGDPHSNFTTVTATNQIQLTRGSATSDWVGSVTVVECTANCTTDGFTLSEVVEHTMAAGTADTQQTTYATLAANHTTNTVPFGGRNGGGISSTSSGGNEYSVTAGVKISKSGTNQIRYDRYGSETRVPGAATLTTYIVDWGSTWTVQSANVTGTSSGLGINSASHYDSAAITSVVRANTFVWGSGFTRDDGLGDGALGQVFTLGDGVTQNANETSVAVGGEGALIAPGRDFEIYAIENPTLSTGYYFHARGDTGATSGYQELNETITATGSTETYDNISTSVRYTQGDRLPLLSTTSGGTGQAYSRTGAWGTRLTSSTNLLWWRAYAGQPVTSWIQIVDFSDFNIGFPDSQQLHYRWRDDTTALNTSGGWLAAEDADPSSVNKLTPTRLRISVANQGNGAEDAARTYQLQFAAKSGFASCSAITTWTGVGSSSTDAVAMYNSSNISPDGTLTTGGLLANTENYSFLSGEGRKSADTTGSIGPLPVSYYTELEYAIEMTEDSIGAENYCFRLYDTTAGATLNGYQVLPELSVSTTEVVLSTLGETGSFASAVDGGWTTITFASTYTTPVVVGTTNTRAGTPALVFESRNVTSTSAEMRVCDSQGSTANGCDTHISETVGYMVVDAAVAATTAGIEAGTFTASGADDSSNYTISYAGTYGTTPLVFANVNTVNSTEFPIEVVINSTTTTNFNAGICDQLLGNNDACDSAHGNETVGWVVVEPGNEPFLGEFDNGSWSIDTGSDSWASVTFAQPFSAIPILISASQTDNGGQDVEIDEAKDVTLTGAKVHFCEIDTTNFCDTHAADTNAWLAIESGPLGNALVLDQDGFRWYAGQSDVTPTTPLGNENTDILNVATNDVLRLRLAAQSTVYDQPVGNFDLKLQYSATSDCAAAGTWTDVGDIGSGVIWRGFNEGGTTTDGSTLPSSLLDGGGNTLMTYEEANNSATNPNIVLKNLRAEWDWVIQNNSAPAVTTYCFRAVSTNGSAIQYTRYPKATTISTEAPQNPNSPASLDQKKTDDTSVSVNTFTNETSVKFTASVSDGNSSDVLSLCVEVQQLGTAFTNTETACGSNVNYSGTAVPADVTISSLTSGQDYHWQVRVKDALGAYSAWVSFGGNAETSRDFSVDTAAPAGIVYDGTSTGVDVDYNDGSLNTLSANWNITDAGSGMSKYEYSIGTIPSTTNVKTWTDVVLATSITDSLLTLNTSQPYYFNVRATDSAGNQSVQSSDGQLIAPTLSFVSSPTTVQFDNLNSSNAFTSTKSTTLTTSTNAYNGYTVRAYASGLLTSGGLDTIQMFNGGTYASPDTWQGGDTGYGYTSNDSSIQGSNIFNGTPCAGGGNPPCYAPFSLTAPGDIVADHTATISGTSVANENFIITHRVTTSSSQEAGDYQTIIIFTVTAIY